MKNKKIWLILALIVCVVMAFSLVNGSTLQNNNTACSITINAENCNVVVSKGKTFFGIPTYDKKHINGESILKNTLIRIELTSNENYSNAHYLITGVENYKVLGSTSRWFKVKGDVVITASAELKTYSLSASGSNIDYSITRNGIAVSLGSNKITYGDRLIINATASQGYEISSLKVNGTNFVNGGEYVVNGKVSIKGVAEKELYDLTCTAPSGSVIIDYMLNGEEITVGADKLKYGDTLRIHLTSAMQWEINSVLINNEIINFDLLGLATINIVGDTNIVINATMFAYDLTATGEHITFSFTKNGTPVNVGNDVLMPNDHLLIFATADVGYQIDNIRINNRLDYVGNYFVVNENVSIVGTASLISYDLSVSGDNIAYTITRNGIAVNPGTDTISYGDNLIITATANTGYALYSLLVNNHSFTNGETYVVNGDVCISSIVNPLQYSLTTNGSNITYTITRNGNVIPCGYTLIFGNNLVITATADTGYQLNSLTINGEPFINGSTYVVNGNVNIVGTASANIYDLTATGEHLNITITRNGNSFNIGTDKVYYGDILTINATVDYGYFPSSIISTGLRLDHGIYFVIGDVHINYTSVRMLYDLATSGSNINYSITRNGTAVNIGLETIYYLDVLTITATADTGYELSTLTINGEPFTNGGTYTVSGDVSIVGTAVRYYELSCSGEGTQFIITRNGDDFNISTDRLYANDVISITAHSYGTYDVVSMTINEEEYFPVNNELHYIIVNNYSVSEDIEIFVETTEYLHAAEPEAVG